jgi:hypothetical protein
LEIVGVWLRGSGHVGSCRGWQAHDVVCVSTHMPLELYRKLTCCNIPPVTDLPLNCRQLQVEKPPMQIAKLPWVQLADSQQFGLAPGLRMSLPWAQIANSRQFGLAPRSRT